MSKCRAAHVVVSGIALIALLCSDAVGAETDARQTAKRARPPKWSADVVNTFFPDARQQLVGTRPDYSRARAVAGSENEKGPKPLSTAATPNAAAWSKLIDAETIETEIKRLAQAVAQDVTTPSEFKGGAYKECRRHFSVLAMLFAVVAEYDGEVRWQDAAPILRETFARAGYNCKVGTDQTYQESTARKQDLADLIGGSRPKLPEAERTANWAQVADRPPIMQRLNIAHQDRLIKWLANERQFEQHREDVRHEAQLVAAIADVIGREGFDYWDDEQYAKYARDLRQAAGDIAAAVDLESYQQARQAGSRMTNACADCHEGYRE